ncbi:glucosylceramide transporter ABCA12-like [Varanus komodoensis]|uniref:glucosylceramide transporter ABCA12-like n=1 Tax=Varanus komodoensis TaxID=61221 RepID=UPI001CF7CF55|nr:glucosylceramide transporter ABCA12-like [Varanus komodoensis]
MLRLTLLQNITSLLCEYESISLLQQTCQLPDINFTELCEQSEFHKKLLHSVEVSVRVASNHRSMSAELLEMLLGDPKKLQQQIDWLQENMLQLQYFHAIPKYMASLNSVMNITKNTPHSRKQDMLIDLFRNVDDLRNELRNTVGMSTESINTLLEMPLRGNKTQLIFQIHQLESCDTDAANVELEVIAGQFCNLSVMERTHKAYVLGVTLLHYLDIYNVMYKVLFPKELQTSLDQVLDLLKDLNHIKKQVASDVHPLLDAIHTLKELQQSRSTPISKLLFDLAVL